MYDAHDPRMIEWEANRSHRESLYRTWCASRHLDPEDTASAVAYERWQVDPDVAATHWPELA